MKREMKWVSFLLMIFLINFASASFSLGNISYSIPTSYKPGDPIIGWINLSLANEPTTALLKTSLGDSINLLELLGKGSNSGYVRTCNPLGCVSNYVANTPETSKILNLAENESVLIGFNIVGDANHLLTDITAFTFNLSSNSPETEKFPLAIDILDDDILDDGSYEWNAYKASDLFGDENKGCFNIATGQANIAHISYCERIRLQKTPQVEIGAYVRGNTPGIDFAMEIKSVDGTIDKKCPTNEVLGSGTLEKVSCIPSNFSINEKGDFFVCIMTSSSLDANKYKIDIEEDESKCGFSSDNGDYPGSYSYDFEIFARPKKYLGGINFSLNNKELTNAKSSLGGDIEPYLEEYISETYGNNCSKGCVIPMKIYSGVEQTITLSNTYVTDPSIIIYVSGLSTETNDFYDVTETPALISSGFQKLNLGESGFRVPLETVSNQTFSITLKDDTGEQILLSEKISVNYGEPPRIKDLIPRRAGVKVPTLFTVLLNGTMNVSRYMWEFGDGKSENTTKPETSHTYSTVGTYLLKVSLLSNKTVFSSREFNITVMTASETVSALLAESGAKIKNIKAEMKNFSSFEQKAINKSLNLGVIEKNIAALNASAVNAGSDEAKYEPILTQLLNIRIPNTIAKTAYSDSISFYPSGTNIDLEVLKAIGGGEYDSSKEELYKEAILQWDAANVNTAVVYNEISALYPDYQDPLVKTFDLRTEKSTDENAYILIRKMDNLMFKEDYSEEEEGDYYYINFDSSEKQITFSTTEDVDFFTLPAFISPALTGITIEEIGPAEGPNPKRWILFSVIVVLVLLIAVALWIILKIWYRRKYEAHLFKNRNNLYNLINYVNNEKIKGVKEGDIAAKLRRTGWSSEQIRYALRKHAGKGTGMPEIRLGKKRKEKV